MKLSVTALVSCSARQSESRRMPLVGVVFREQEQQATMILPLDERPRALLPPHALACKIVA